VTVGVVTDSAAALPDDIVRDLRIGVVPMWVMLDGASEHADRIDLDAMFTHREISTSGPTPGEFQRAIDEAAAGSDVCVLTISATMSSTYEAARVGATGSERDDATVRVVDTRTAAGAQALVVIAAARAARAGATLDEVVAVAEQAMREVRLIAAVPDLTALVHSGRVPGIAGWAGRRLGLVPLFEFRDGGAHPMRPSRGLENALERIVARCRREQSDDGRLHVAALHALAPDAAEDMLRRVHKELEVESEFVASFGAVMLAHTGPGLVGLAWRWEKGAPATISARS
jgi:DegV family protein with EDD domain